MSAHAIKVPDIGEGIAEVELVAWHVKPGDTVVEDQALADVMTDKATVEIPSPVVGKVIALGGEVGQQIAVGAELIRIDVDGAEATVEKSATAQKGTPAVDVTIDAAAPVAATAAPASARAAVPAPARAPARASALSTAVAAATDRAAQALAASAPRKADERPIASPAVRRRAWELGIELTDVTPSGTGGRIMQADLDRHAASGVRSKAPGTSVPTHAERNDEETVKVIGLRRKIAQKMQESKRRIPHFTYVEEVDVTELEALRASLNAKWGAERERLTLLPLLMRAVVLAVREFPQINARFDDEAGVVTRYGAVHIGIATQTDSGLMVPVVRHAEARDLWSSAAEVSRLALAAREGRATRDELSGSTITITSLGALGGVVSTPVINHPEVAIVGVNRIALRPMMRDGAVVPRQMMNLSSSFDHRVVDGVHAAQFVQALRRLLENPAMLFV